MKILFCSSNPMIRSLGASKALFDLSEELNLLGWKTEFVSPPDLLGSKYQRLNGNSFLEAYSRALRGHLLQNAARHDIIDYDHVVLPYPRNDFPRDILMVARSSMLAFHFKPELIKILSRPANTWEAKFKSYIKGILRTPETYESQIQKNISFACRTVSEADLINVLNEDDRSELVRNGVLGHRVCVIPCGINRSSRPLFDAISSAVPLTPRVAFVGTFDNRKGARDFAGIFANIKEGMPGVTFRLLGTRGLYRSSREVLHCFPANIRDRIEVIPRFDPSALPKLLSDCSLGIFPSYLEGFGLGVLEMMAASLPVIAYKAPGVTTMLNEEYLVPSGDVDGMAAKALTLLRDHQKLSSARIWAKNRSQEFSCASIARQTSAVYMEFLEKIRSEKAK